MALSGDELATQIFERMPSAKVRIIDAAEGRYIATVNGISFPISRALRDKLIAAGAGTGEDEVVRSRS